MAKGNGVLVALAPREESTVRAMRNIPFAQVLEMRNLNAYDVMQYKYILFQKEALAALK
jgi:ribosomal protein L4